MDLDGDIGAKRPHFIKTVDYPVELYQSLKGRYFTAQTPCLFVGGESSAWGALVNPSDSGVNLYFFVATLNYISGENLTIGYYMNSELPGRPRKSNIIAPANTAIEPLPEPRTFLLYASDVRGFPEGGELMFSRTAYANQFMTVDGDGRFIVPPGGNCGFFLSPLSRGEAESKVYLAFGFWEAPV